MLRRALVVLIVLAWALAPAVRAQETPAPSAASAPDPEPVFMAFDGSNVRVSQRRGKVILLNFWATYCGPCRAEMPQIQKLHEELGPKGLLVLGAAANGRDEVEPVKAAMNAAGARFETWVWVNAKDMRWYGVGPGIPATVLIDREGKIRQRFQGAVTADQLRPILETLLAEAPPK